MSSDLLQPLIATLADNKYFLGRRYAEWCTAAPTLESAVAAAAMAQDEIGHARSFYPVLREVAGDSPENEAETRTNFTQIPFLSHPFDSWTDFVAANFLFDTAVTVLLESARESSFGPLAQRARRILEEEPLHWLHAEGWTRRLAATSPSVQRALDGSLRLVGAESLQWLRIATGDLQAAGILDADAPRLQARWRDRVNPVLAAAGLAQQ
jgi:phenylacetate-CoA oxygenase PaaI subunit